jgi:cytochrome b6-f complex iron-sulfur subunit
LESDKNPTPPGDGAPAPAEPVPAKSAAEGEQSAPPDRARVDTLLRAAAGLPPARKKEPPVKTQAAGGEWGAVKSSAPGAQMETPAGTPPAARVAPGAAKAGATPTASVAKGVPKAAARPAGALVEAPPDPPINKMRRRITWAAIAGFLGVCFASFLRFFLPRTITEPSSTFRIGFPGDYAQGVDTKWQQQYRIWVDKTSDRLFVIYARCTHLGCTPDWKASENKFKCPCHGSGYDSEGVNFEGPAPRPMDRAHVSLDAEGQIVVDTSRLYQNVKGGVNQFDDDGAYLPL